jgi:hypothetical protein
MEGKAWAAAALGKQMNRGQAKKFMAELRNSKEEDMAVIEEKEDAETELLIMDGKGEYRVTIHDRARRRWLKRRQAEQQRAARKKVRFQQTSEEVAPEGAEDGGPKGAVKVATEGAEVGRPAGFTAPDGSRTNQEPKVVQHRVRQGSLVHEVEVPPHRERHPCLVHSGQVHRKRQPRLVPEVEGHSTRRQSPCLEA